MDRNGNNHRIAEKENGHLSEDDLLLYADGELNRDQASKAETHLEACWSCRARAEKYEETIRSYVDYCETIQKPMDEAPPGGWRRFDSRLAELVVVKSGQSPVSRLRGWLASLRPSPPNLSFNPQFAGRLAAVLLIAGAVIAVLLIRSNQVTVVSASELLQRSIDAQSMKLRATTQPVVHQRLQLRRKDQMRDEVLRWETWDDRVNARFVQTCDGCAPSSSKGKSVPATSNAQDPKAKTPSLLSDLNAVLIANHMDPQQPLSAASFQSWHRTLQHQRDEVSKMKLVDGSDGLSLHTIAARPVSSDQISEAMLFLHASDWQPVELVLTLESENERVLYELTAGLSEVVSLNTLDPKIFSSEPVAAKATSSPPTPNAQPAISNSASPLALNSLPPAASADLEVEALRLLHEAGADLGEQITVKRGEGGLVRISGIVDTDQRKQEVITALKSIAHNPVVQIDIQTIAEAVAKQKRNVPTTQRATNEGIEIQSTAIPVEAELRAYFDRRGGNSDAAIRQFAAGMISQSSQAMQHLGALKRLANQFSAEQLRSLSPEARANWLRLLRAHAEAYQQRSAALRRELKPAFFASASEDMPNVPEITSDEGLKRLVQELFATGAGNDQVICSAFAVTSERSRFTAIGSPQFWDAMKKGEALAARIALAK